MNLIRVEKINYNYDKYNANLNNALNDISFEINKKDFISIIGKSGSGKSTLIKTLNGLIKVDSGNIYYKDKNIYDKDFDITKLRFNLGLVFQYPEYQLFSETVLSDICFGAIKKGFSNEEAENKAMNILKELDILDLKDESPFNLSGGEKRKVAFAGVLVMEPEILVFDEPEAGLDPISKNNFFNYLKYLNEVKDITIIFVTHNLDDACEYSNKTMLINDGFLLKYDTPYNVFSDFDIIKKAELELPNSINILNKLNINNCNKLKFNDILEILKK